MIDSSLSNSTQISQSSSTENPPSNSQTTTFIPPITNSVAPNPPQKIYTSSKLYIAITWLVFLSGLQSLLSISQNLTQNLISQTQITATFIIIYTIGYLTGIGLILTSFGLRKYKKGALTALIILTIVISINLVINIFTISLGDQSTSKLIIPTLLITLFGIAIRAIIPIYFWKQYKKREQSTLYPDTWSSGISLITSAV